MGWDPVLTTCILGKILERIRTSHETQHGNHRVDHEKYCEAIYWKHHTSHHLTKNSHTITFQQFFFTKIPSLLKLIFVMGCGWGYGNYRSDEQREGPVFFGFVIFKFACVFCSGLRGYFGVGSGTHYMYSRKDLGTYWDITRDTTR